MAFTKLSQVVKQSIAIEQLTKLLNNQREGSSCNVSLTSDGEICVELMSGMLGDKDTTLDGSELGVKEIIFKDNTSLSVKAELKNLHVNIEGNSLENVYSYNTIENCTIQTEASVKLDNLQIFGIVPSYSSVYIQTSQKITLCCKGVAKMKDLSLICNNLSILDLSQKANCEIKVNNELYISETNNQFIRRAFKKHDMDESVKEILPVRMRLILSAMGIKVRGNLPETIKFLFASIKTIYCWSRDTDKFELFMS